MFEAIPAIARMKADLDDLAVDETSPIAANGKTLTGSELGCRLPKPGHMKRQEENREYLRLTYKRMCGEEDSGAVGRLKTSAVTRIKECVDTRFVSLGSQNNNTIYDHMLHALCESCPLAERN